MAVLFVTGVRRRHRRPRQRGAHTAAAAVLVGATAASVLVDAQEVEERPAVVLFAASWGGRLRTGSSGARAVHFASHREGEGWRLTGTGDVAVDGATLVLLADPFTFPVDGFVDELARRAPGLTVVGGLASAARGPGGNRLVADDLVTDRGAVGLFLPPGVPVRALVSQGCRPVGDPLVITRARDNLIEEIAGRPALDRLFETAEAVSPEDRSLMAQSLQVGLVLDEAKESFGPGDFLVRPVLGADRESRAVAVGSDVEVGTTVQFQVRDAASASADLRATLAEAADSAALVFTCSSRGSHLFGEPGHDAETVHAHVDGGAVAGMFCAGEVGPVGGRPFVHGFTASVLLLDE
ncbi:MAG: FIST C-terminal domain-containing protein [Acidimicrobiales bacterium]